MNFNNVHVIIYSITNILQMSATNKKMKKSKAYLIAIASTAVAQFTAECLPLQLVHQ